MPVALCAVFMYVRFYQKPLRVQRYNKFLTYARGRGVFGGKSGKEGGYGRRVRRRGGAWQSTSFIAHVWSILWRKDAGRLFGERRRRRQGLAETAARTRQEGEDGGRGSRSKSTNTGPVGRGSRARGNSREGWTGGSMGEGRKGSMGGRRDQERAKGA